MVAIVTGSGSELFATSLNTINGAGMLGHRVPGQHGDRSQVNAMTRNLVRRLQDEQLPQRSANVLDLRTYNSQGLLTGAPVDGSAAGPEENVVVITDPDPKGPGPAAFVAFATAVGSAG